MTEHVDPNNIVKLWFYRLIKLTAFAAIIVAFYVIYLDAWVQKKMSGPKWQAPVKVFARPLQLHPLLFLSPNELISELKLLSYRPVKNVREPGQYSASTTQVTFYNREFIYTKGTVLPKKVRISFSDQRVSKLEVFDQQWQESQQVLVEPLLLSRQSDNNNEHREIINLATVPEWMIDTLLTVEDKNFYHHHGVSFFAIARALIANLQAGRKVQGGSTITQQLAKNLLLNDSRKSYLRKIKEALVALVLDYRYSKDDILEAYFNEIYLGQNGNHGIHGFALASKFYFNKPLTEIEQHEFALLVAMVKGPSYYNPLRHQSRALERRDLVLQIMVSENVIDSSEYEYYIQQPMAVTKNKGHGRTLFPSYMQLVLRELKALELSSQDTEQGLLVFTGLDPVLQHNYETLFGQSIKKLEKVHELKDVNGAAITLNLDNASIAALIGDKVPNSYGFNRALDANRNIGSLIKPAVYLTALQHDKYHLASSISNQEIQMKNNRGKEWRPQNYDKTTSESIWLFDALVNSKNLPTIYLGMEVGIKNVVKTMKKLGVEQHVPTYPSLLLGAVSMTPLDVLKMYQPIASFGQKLQISSIVHITDPNGISVWQKSKQYEQVMNYETGYLLNHALHQVTRQGTAKRLGLYYPKVNYAGKTGTTDDLRDSWFTGFDQNKLTTVWIGKDDNTPVELTGSQGALGVFLDLQAAKSSESLKAPKPSNVEFRVLESTTGKVLEKECGEHIVLPIKLRQIKEVKECPGFFDFLK